MRQKKPKKQAKIKKAVAASVERSKERAKIEPAKKHTKFSNVSRSDLIVQMGENAYELGVLQEEIGTLQREHNRLQAIVQQIKKELDKRSEK